MEKACTFFGHRDCPSSIKPKLREVLIDLIENHTIDVFYVGQQGAFDGIVRSVPKELVSILHQLCRRFRALAPKNETNLIPLITPTPCFRRHRNRPFPFRYLMAQQTND